MFRRLCSPTSLALLTAALLFLPGRQASAQLRRDGDRVSLSTQGFVFADFDLNIAYDPVRRVYLIVGIGARAVTGPGFFQVFQTLSGIFVDAAGHALTSEFIIHENPVPFEFPDFQAINPHVVYSADVSDGAGGFGGFLVVWRQQSIRFLQLPDEVHARAVAYPTGSVGNSGLLGRGFFIQLSDVAYSDTGKRFLVGWSASVDQSGSAASTVFRPVGLDGQPVGSATTRQPPCVRPAMGWDRSRDEFVVTCVEVVNDTSLVLLRVAVDGTVRRRDLVVTVPGTGSFGNGNLFGADVSFSPRTGNHVVTWLAPTGLPGSQNYELYSAEIDSTSEVMGSRLAFSGPIFWQSIAYNAASTSFAMVGDCREPVPGPRPPIPPPAPVICVIELDEHGELISGVVPGPNEFNPEIDPQGVHIVSRPDSGGWLAVYNYRENVLQAFQTTALCQVPDPFGSLGGGVCVNGGWLPPGFPGIGESVPLPSPPPPAGCSSPDPFGSLGGGVCVNGGWLPPGFPGTAGSTPPPAPQPTPVPVGCSGSDPFASLPTLIGRCVNGGWIPVPGVKTIGTVRFFATGTGVWVIEGSDGTLYEPSGGLDPAFRTAGLAVFVEAELIPTGTPTLPQATVVEIHTIVMSAPSW